MLTAAAAWGAGVRAVAKLLQQQMWIERWLLWINQSINQSCIFRVVQVIKSLQDPLEAGNNLPGINDNVME